MRIYTLYEKLEGEEPRLMATLHATVGGADQLSLGPYWDGIGEVLEAFAEAVEEVGL